MEDHRNSGVRERALRELAGAVRAARLYPPTSEIPLRCASAAAELLGAVCAQSGGMLAIGVSRDGLLCDGLDATPQAPAVAELADLLRDHGVASVTVRSAVNADDILALAAALHEQPSRLRSQGGVAGVLERGGINRLVVSCVALTIAAASEASGSVADEIENWLQTLSADADRLTAWLTSASALDSETLEQSLLELEQAAGALGAGLFDSALAQAFDRQSPGVKDAVLAIANDSPRTRALMGRMFKELTPESIACSIVGGSLGKNMLSLSHALTTLPLGDVFGQVRNHVIEAASQAGRTDKEVAFLEHMIDARMAPQPAHSLAETDSRHGAVSRLAALSDEEISSACGVVVTAERTVSKAGVRAMLMLLDNQRSFRMYCETLEAVLAMVPGLIVADELSLANEVLRQVAVRHEMNTAPWPELTDRLEVARAAAVRPDAMRSLLTRVAADHLVAIEAREIVSALGDSAAEELARQSLVSGASGLEAAERVLGSSRMVAALCTQAATAEPGQLEALTARLAREHDPACVEAVTKLLARPDVHARRQVAKGLASAAAPARSRLLATALRDSDREVVTTVASGIARCGVPGSAELLGSRLDELNVDGADFEIARDLIGALAKTPEPAAGVVLERLAGRRSLIKRGHFAQVQAAVAQALRVRAEGGGLR